MAALPDYNAESNNLTNLELLNRLQDIMNSFVISNILLVGQAPTPTIVTFYYPNLYRVAVQYYTDANLWTVIAAANGLTDPKVNSVISLLIPPRPSVDTGGILNPITT